jgi:hypothetical protein
MQVRRVEPTRSDRRRFVSFPHRLYRSQSNWLPTMRAEEMVALHPSHPFYRHSEAAFFIAERDDTVVGRIGVFEHVPANGYHGHRVAYFGWFECEDDHMVADALFETVGTWARDRGLTELIGPKGLLPSDGHGTLVEGFEHPAVLGVGWHHPYYDRLITGAGLVKGADYLSGALDTSHPVPDQVHEAADAALVELGYEIRTFTSKRQLRPWIIRLGRMYNDAMAGNWEYTPVDDVEIETMSRRLLPVADPRLVVLLMHREEVAGYLLILPDVGDAIRAIRGRLLPLGWIRLTRSVRTAQRVNIVAMGLTPEHRGVGANLVLYSRLARGAQRYRFGSGEIIQVEEGNAPMMRNLERLDVPWTKRHRMYRMQLV